ncbi:MAG: UvrD-helicase domain-containing protein [Candidatus Riflebacteria bacterium]|nr:UvrD-helicase domain-containing protein [Candidatus Riflebacteria bacterium]
MNPTLSQQKAINSNSPSILVIAGAGSGKTATTIARIERLILQEKVNPKSILCLTFTRKAALEIKERLSKKIDKYKVRQIWAGTFHAICYRILMQWGSQIGYQASLGQKITVITPEESEILLKEIIKAYCYKSTLKSVTDAKNELAHDGKEPENEDIKRILAEYNNRLKECNAVDFDQLLLEVQKLFQKCPEALEHYRTRFEHIFVDEYQDTDRIQYNLHEILQPRNLFCVGDSDQAIYGWRGANVNIILNFEKDHPGAEVIKLEECFRCADLIVNHANNLIRNNSCRIEKNLIGATGREGVFEVCGNSSPEYIAEYLCEYMSFEHPSQVAVIARTHRTLEAIEKACNEFNLEVLRVGKTTAEIEQDPSFQFFRAYLRLLTNPKDNIAFLTANKIGFKFDLNEVWQKANEEGCSWFEGIEVAKIKRSYQDYSVDKVYSDMINSFPELKISQEVSDYLKINFPGMDASDWLEEYQLRDHQLELENNPRDKITLITAHAAKGLEWDNVLIVDFDEKKFPSSFALKSGNLEEERRLAYVAFTRARNRLLIFSNESLSKVPSRFIVESQDLPFS